MVHKLAHSSPGMLDPVTITVRYRCGCANNEVITISVVLPIDIPEEHFAGIVANMRYDLRREIEQHLERRN